MQNTEQEPIDRIIEALVVVGIGVALLDVLALAAIVIWAANYL